MVQNDTAVFSRVRYTFRAPVNYLQRNREYVFKRPMKIGVRVHESPPYVFLKRVAINIGPLCSLRVLDEYTRARNFSIELLRVTREKSHARENVRMVTHRFGGFAGPSPF